MDHRLEQDALIEDALKSQPLAPMPRDVTASVMARIRVEKRPALVSWNDLAITFVIAVTAGALLITYKNLPPVTMAKLRIQGILLHQDFIVNAHWLVPVLLFGAASFFFVFIVPYVRRELRR